MEKSLRVLFAGEGAEAFAKEQGIEFVDQKYFSTGERWKELAEEKAKAKSAPGGGTVGAVALDQAGNLAAATSTGGMTNKPLGRIGDSPIIGAGTYANNATCAISATGDGEYFIRSVVAHDVSALLEYRGMPLKDAAQTAIDKVGKLGGKGGLIAIDQQGNIALPFNSMGMYRGYLDASGQPVVEIYK